MGQKDVSVVLTSKLLWTSKRKRETDVFTERDQSDRKKLIFKICAQTYTHTTYFLIYYISDNTPFLLYKTWVLLIYILNICVWLKTTSGIG